jgi:hypothetical protein
MIVFDALTAAVTSLTASSTAETQSLFALGPVRGNIAPTVTLIAGVVGLLLLSPQPPMAAGINNDNVAPRMETFRETLGVADRVSWVMPCQIGSARDLLECWRSTVRQNRAENARAGAGWGSTCEAGRDRPRQDGDDDGDNVFRAPALRFEAPSPGI